jgi:hypothetical protein
MELDQLKKLWAAQQQRLDKSLQLNESLLAQMNLGRTRQSLRGLSAGIGFEIVGLALIMLMTGSFGADHVRDLDFFIPALAIWGYALAILIAETRQLVEIRRIDFDEPVVAIQVKIEQVRLRRAKIIGWLLAFGPLLWLPATIVVMRSLLGIDLYAHVTAGWIAANVVFGIAVIPLCIWIARRFGDRLGKSPTTRSFVDAIAGNSMSEALQSLDTIRRFEQEM